MSHCSLLGPGVSLSVWLVGSRQKTHHARRTQKTTAANHLALGIEDQNGWNTVNTITPGYGDVTIDIDEERNVGLGHRVFHRVSRPHVMLHDDAGRAPVGAEIHKHHLFCALGFEKRGRQIGAPLDRRGRRRYVGGTVIEALQGWPLNGHHEHREGGPQEPLVPGYPYAENCTRTTSTVHDSHVADVAFIVWAAPSARRNR